MKKAYPTLLTQTLDKKDTVLIEVPDLNILTEGFGIEDAIYMARDAIGLTCITKQDENKDIPEPSSVEKINVEKGTFADAGKTILTLVDIDLDEYRRKVDNRSVRRNVTIPNWLNREAEKANLNVSRVLQDALKEKLGVA